MTLKNRVPIFCFKWIHMLSATALLGASPLLGACDEGSGGDRARHANKELSSLELWMVGVWKAQTSSKTTLYMVFNEDRTGCEWERYEDDFGRRDDEFHFNNWHLIETLDEDNEMVITLENQRGETHEIDRYEPFKDRVYPAGLSELKLYWRDMLIDCNDRGSSPYASDVERRGSKYGGEKPPEDEGSAPSF